MPATASSKTSKARARGAAASPTDAILLLEADHQAVDTDFEAFAQLTDAVEKKALAAKICLALTVHAIIEEEIFYPAAREALGPIDLLDEAIVEHEGAKVLVAQIKAMAPDLPLFDAKVSVLGEQVRHHVREEEDELFPQIRETKLDLEVLGERLAARKAELLAQLAPTA